MTSTTTRSRRFRLGVAATAFAALAGLGLSGCGESETDASTSSAASSVVDVSAEQGVALLGGAEALVANAGSPDLTILDVRTPGEFAQGHLPGAVNLDLNGSEFSDGLAALDKGATYFVYCQTSNRSGTATQMMADAGFDDVYDLQGGIVAWAQQGLPVVG
jgi:rhodanese-related sulfurtransferase